MPSKSLIVTSNAAQQLLNKQVLVVGGTSGIGEYTAKRLAAMKANVAIAGRNEEAAKIILEKLKELCPTGNHTFHKVDMSLVSEAKNFAKKYMENHSLLHYLVISCGFLSTAGRTETKEGIDRKMATHYYGRWALINEIMPLLEKTAKDSDARVLTILGAAQGGAINPQDLDLKTTFSVKNAAMAAPTYNDLMVEELALRHPNVSFVHAYPGFVKTSLSNGLPLILRIPMSLVSFFSSSPEDCAEAICYALTNEKYKKGHWLVNEKGDESQKNPKIHTEEARKIVWDHTVELVQAALKK